VVVVVVVGVSAFGRGLARTQAYVCVPIFHAYVCLCPFVRACTGVVRLY